jgi:hypothetical protein
MASTQRSNLIYPTVLQEEVSKGIAGVNIFGGSKAVVINPTLQNGRDRVGADVAIPYFDSIGKAQIIPEGGAITPKRLTQSSESGTVIHLGDAVSINTLAAMATQGRDIYQVAREMLLAGLAAKMEDIIVQRLVARAVAASMVYDGSSGNVSSAAINGTMQKFGDELVKPAPALWFAKSNVMWDIAALSDSTGRPLYVQAAGSLPASINNIPLVMSDKADLVLGTSPETYYSMLVKEGAVAAWMDPNITIEEDRDSLADDTLLVFHAYMILHAYGTMAGGTKAGVAAMKTRAST